MEIKDMDHFFDKGLVSIIMLSHGDSTHIVETVKSIFAQTYQNSCVPMVLGQAKRQGRAASAASVERGIPGSGIFCDAQAQYQDYSNLSECPMLQKEV